MTDLEIELFASNKELLNLLKEQLAKNIQLMNLLLEKEGLVETEQKVVITSRESIGQLPWNLQKKKLERLYAVKKEFHDESGDSGEGNESDRLSEQA